MFHQTFFRNYDPAIGRFIASNPMPESAASMTTYQYAGNNAVMGNDPMGNINRLPVAPSSSYGGDFSSQDIEGGDAFINDIAGYTAQQEAADGDDSGGGDGGGGSNNSSGVDPYVYNPTSLASSPYYGSNVYRPNGQTIHIDDGSNADYLELANGVLQFTGYSDQGGTNTRNMGTELVYPFILASGNYTNALDVVIIHSTATGQSANQDIRNYTSMGNGRGACGSCVPGDWIGNGNGMRVPDYYALNISIPLPATPLLSWNPSMELDRFGKFHYSYLGASLGPNLAEGLPISLTANWLMQPNIPSQLQLNTFLNGTSYSIGGGYWFGGSISWNNSGRAFGVGFFIPQVGVSDNYTQPVNTH